MKISRQQQGVTVVEALLIIIVIALVGFAGWFVYHKEHKTTDSSKGTAPHTASVTNFEECKQSAGSKMLETAPEQCVTKDGKKFTDTGSQSQKYLAITEWDVKIPYSGSDTFTYQLKGSTQSAVTVISKNLADKYGCINYGAGTLSRLLATDASDAEGHTVAQRYASDPSAYTKLGNYYYGFTHDQAECNNAPINEQNAANDAVKAALTKIQAAN
jgi:hypothetical protein